MKVTIAAGGRFHAIALATELAKRDALQNLITFSYTKADAKFVPEKFVCQSSFCKCLDLAYCKLRLNRIISPSRFNVFKDNFFDNFVKSQIDKSPHIDIFVGWAHYVLKSIPIIKKKAKKFIIESGSCHILEQQKILLSAYEELGILHTPIDHENISKMTQEYELADYIVTPSSFAKNSFISQGISSQKILVVPCGSNTTFFSQRRNVIPKKFTALFVGLLSVRKGVHKLIEAWIQLGLDTNKAELILVGSLQKDLSTTLGNKKLPSNIIFQGSVDKDSLKKLYSSTSVLVLPSLEDGFGMVIGEAMASGVPVIATTHSGGPDIITKDSGFIIPSNDSSSIANKLLWCFENQEELFKMGCNAQKQVDKLSWDTYGKNIYQTYQNILEQR